MKPTIFVLRHGEKPGEHDVNRKSDGPGLSCFGLLRAQGLAINHPFSEAKIDYIFATKASKESIRPIETVIPLAKACKLTINTKFKNAGFAELAKHLQKKKYQNKVIVICWHHGELPELIHALGGDIKIVLPIVDGKWDAKVFNRIIKLYQDTASGDDYSIESYSQSMLMYDSEV